MPKQTTVGQILINSILPTHLRNYERVLDKKGIGEIMEGVAKENDPELYRNVVKAMHDLGAHVAQSTGSSFSIRDLQTPPKTRAMMDALRAKVTQTIERDDLTSEQKNAAVQSMVMKAAPRVDATLNDELISTGNPFGVQILSGSRGSLGDVRSMMAGDLMVTDHKDRLVPIPILGGYATGVDAAEYWAGSYGARKGGISTKLSTARTGFLGKQLVQVAHRSVVTTDDCGTQRGIPVGATDSDNEGTVLVEEAAGIPAGTVIDSKVMRTLNSKLKDDDEIMVRSPLTCKAKRGVCAKCTGVRERGGFPEIGDPVGMSAAHAVAERVTQAALSLKHGGGRATGKEQQDVPQGYQLINQLMQVPKSFKGGATVASEDGTVKAIDKAPQGGYNITIGEATHHVLPGFDVKVKPGDRVEAGDVMSDGIPNPADLVKHRGIGDGRMSFVKIFRDALKSSGTSTNRRNIEMLARGLVNHVRVTDVDGVDDALPDDVVEYNNLERNYRPRYGARTQTPQASLNKFLEVPIRQYSVGTRVTKRVANDLKKRGVKEVRIHDDPPPFQPEMTRAMAQMSISPDWQMRLGGSYLQRGLLDAVHRGRSAEIASESYIPGMARGKGFGEELKTKGIY